MEHIPCNVSLVEANALRCSLLVSTWNKYKERKMTIEVCFVLVMFPKPFSFNDTERTVSCIRKLSLSLIIFEQN